ncbi:hypothetical protein TYRP_019821 [Tyrophagus putrescentiae]|nr:hypothetical protein TYRP_019821 [Tyrophagus putrescentiae]
MGKRSRSTTTTSLWVLASLFLFTCFWAAFWSPRSPFSGTASTASPGVETSADFNEVNEKTEAPPTTPAFGSLTLLCARDDRQCPTGPDSNLTQISPSSSSKQIKAICFKGFGFLGGGGGDHLEDQVQCYKVAGSEDRNCSGNGHLTTANASVSDGLLPKVVNSEAIGGNSSQQKESGNQSTSLPSMNGPASNSRLRALMYTCAPKKFTNSIVAGRERRRGRDPEWDEPWNYRFLVSYRGRWIDPHDQSFTIWKVYVGGREGGSGFVGDRRVPMDIGVAGLPLRVAEVDGEGDRYHPGGHGLSRRFHSRGFRGVVGGGRPRNQTPHPRRGGVSGVPPRTAPLPPLTSAPDYEDDVPGGRSVAEGYPPQNVITTAPPQSNDIGLNILNELPTERGAFQLILTVIHEDEGGEGVSQASAGCPPAPPPSAHTSPTATTTTTTTTGSPPPPYSAVTKYAAKKWVKKVAEV